MLSGGIRSSAKRRLRLSFSCRAGHRQNGSGCLFVRVVEDNELILGLVSHVQRRENAHVLAVLGCRQRGRDFNFLVKYPDTWLGQNAKPRSFDCGFRSSTASMAITPSEHLEPDERRPPGLYARVRRIRWLCQLTTSSTPRRRLARASSLACPGAQRLQWLRVLGDQLSGRAAPSWGALRTGLGRQTGRRVTASSTRTSTSGSTSDISNTYKLNEKKKIMRNKINKETQLLILN